MNTDTATALQEINKQFQATFDQAGVGLTRMALDGRFLRVNQKFCDIVGYTQEELLQRTCQEITYPEDLEPDISCIRRLLTGGARSYTREKRYIRKDGGLVWTEVTFSLVQDETEEPLWILSVVHEISKRKRLEEALLASEEKFRTLVTKTEELVFMIAADGTFLLSEGKGLAKLDLKPGQVVGKSVFELYKDYPDMLDEMRRAFNGETVTGEVYVDGNYFRSWYTPHKNHENEIIGLLGLSVNITEQKQAEEKLQEYQLRLKALAFELTRTEERERRNIALDLHDYVGQSLAVMRMQLAAAQKEPDSSKLAAILGEVSGSLREAIQDTRHVISDLSSPLINELGLAAALSEWLKVRIGDRYGLETEFIDDGKPKPLDDDTRAILYRSVRELLANVIKHANATRVSVSLQRRDGVIRIIVEDDGAGMADGWRLDTDSTEGGFGLFSINERLSDLNGLLEIESRPGRGVRVTLTAPLEPGQ